MDKKIGLRYIRPKQILSLDDIPWGELKRGIYVCTSTTHPPDLREGDLIYEIDTKRLLNVDEHLNIQPLGQVSWVEEHITLTSTDINNKYVQLSFDPLLDTVMMFISGLMQVRGVDYDVNVNRLYWNGLELENDLEAGDTLVVRYIPA